MANEDTSWSGLSGAGKALLAVFAVLLVAGLVALQGWLVMLLLGALSASTGLPALGFWSSAGLSVLTTILFKNPRLNND